jgi:hypothetical protein
MLDTVTLRTSWTSYIHLQYAFCHTFRKLGDPCQVGFAGILPVLESAGEKGCTNHTQALLCNYAKTTSNFSYSLFKWNRIIPVKGGEVEMTALFSSGPRGVWGGGEAESRGSRQCSGSGSGLPVGSADPDLDIGQSKLAPKKGNQMKKFMFEEPERFFVDCNFFLTILS